MWTKTQYCNFTATYCDCDVFQDIQKPIINSITFQTVCSPIIYTVNILKVRNTNCPFSNQFLHCQKTHLNVFISLFWLLCERLKRLKIRLSSIWRPQLIRIPSISPSSDWLPCQKSCDWSEAHLHFVVLHNISIAKTNNTVIRTQYIMQPKCKLATTNETTKLHETFGHIPWIFETFKAWFPFDQHSTVAAYSCRRLGSKTSPAINQATSRSKERDWAAYSEYSH